MDFSDPRLLLCTLPPNLHIVDQNDCGTRYLDVQICGHTSETNSWKHVSGSTTLLVLTVDDASANECLGMKITENFMVRAVSEKLWSAAGVISVGTKSCEESLATSSRGLSTAGVQHVSMTELKTSQHQLFSNFLDSFLNIFWTFEPAKPLEPPKREGR